MSTNCMKVMNLKWLSGVPAFQELELKLLLEVRKGLINVLIPSLHEPRSPYEGGLELVKVPLQNIANFELCLDYLFGCHRVICWFCELLYAGRVNFFELGSHMQACDPYELKLWSFDMMLAVLQVIVCILQSQMVSLPLEAVVGWNLAQPVKQGQSHVWSQLSLPLK